MLNADPQSVALSSVRRDQRGGSGLRIFGAPVDRNTALLALALVIALALSVIALKLAFERNGCCREPGICLRRTCKGRGACSRASLQANDARRARLPSTCRHGLGFNFPYVLVRRDVAAAL